MVKLFGGTFESIFQILYEVQLKLHHQSSDLVGSICLQAEYHTPLSPLLATLFHLQVNI